MPFINGVWEPFELNDSLVRDYAHTYPARTGETLLHFGDSWNAPDRVEYEQHARQIVYDLARRQRICQPGKQSGHTGLVELVRVVEQTGFTEADQRPVRPDDLVRVLKQITSYPVTQHTVTLAGRDQVVVCVDILAPLEGHVEALRPAMLKMMQGDFAKGIAGEDLIFGAIQTFWSRATVEDLDKLARELMPQVDTEAGKKEDED